jgi:hypothetical protein
VVLDAATLENGHHPAQGTATSVSFWRSWLAPPEAIVLRRQVLLTLSTLGASILILGLESQSQKTAPDSLFIHLEEQQQFLHFEGSQPSGRPQLWRTKGKTPSWPELHSQSRASEIKTHLLSKLSQWPQGHSVIFYDGVNPRLSPKLWFSSTAQRQLVILLDRSGTMNSGDKGQPKPLVQAHQLLSQRRQQSKQAWRVYSFGDELFDHGHWNIGEAAPPQMFEPKGGKTPLLAHLHKLFNLNTEAIELIVISDGRLDTRDQNSIKSQMERWNRKGHRIHMLSPSGGGLESWKFIAASGLISDTWPFRQQHSPQARNGHDRLIPCEWENIRPTSAKPELGAILWDSEGEALVYSDSSTAEETFHVVAEPRSSSALIDWLGQRHQGTPSLHFSDNHLTIHLPAARGQAPICQWPKLGLEKLDSKSFKLRLPTTASSLSFFHPSCGSFGVDGLKIWHAYEGSAKTKGRLVWSWRWPGELPKDWRSPSLIAVLSLYALAVLLQISYRRLQNP